MSSYRLTRRAEQDLIDIYCYTLSSFGIAQAELYTEDIRACLEMLADHPRLGRRADRVSPGLRRHEHGSHVIFYRERAEERDLLVLAVIHARMRPDLIDVDLSEP